IFNLAVDHGDGAHCFIGCQDHAVSVHDLSPRRLDLPFALVEVLGQLLIIFCVEDHKIDKPADQTEDHDYRTQKHHKDFLLIISLILHNKTNPAKDISTI